MPRVITIPDLDNSVAAFDKMFSSFSVSNQSDGAGGTDYSATLTVKLFDSEGNHYRDASVTWDLGPAVKIALRDLAVQQGLPKIKEQEGL